jgi:hypothetical protein
MNALINVLSCLSFKKYTYNEIDVVIPCVERDYHILTLLIKSLKVNCINPIRIIYVVGPSSELLESKGNECGYMFINEKEIITDKFDKVNYFVEQVNRKGWLIQQLIKLHVNEISKSKFVLVIDADTILTQKQFFVINSKIILNYSDEYHLPYHAVVKKLLNIENTYKKSFVSHMMVIDTQILKSLQNHLCSSDKEWVDVIIQAIDFKESSCFSEFELLGNYYYYFYANRINLSYWNNISLSRNSEELDFYFLNEKYKKFKSASFHWYNCE